MRKENKINKFVLLGSFAVQGSALSEKKIYMRNILRSAPEINAEKGYKFNFASLLRFFQQQWLSRKNALCFIKL